MFGYPSGIIIPGYIPEEALSTKSGKSTSSNKSGSNKSSSIKSGATSHSDILFGHYNSNSSITTVTSNNTTSTALNRGRNGSISSVLTPPTPPSPTASLQNSGMANNPYYRGGGTPKGGMASLAEEDVPPPYISQQHTHHQQQQQHQSLEDYRQCLQWLQQTCRPVFMKELTQLNTVPVPITPANAKHPSQIGGTQLVQIASWKQSQVQILPIDRWGQAQDVLDEIRALHRLRKCRHIIQLYGYLPNATLAAGQMPALLLQQPSYGSLRQFLDHHFDSIQWPERYKLALDMAQGLRYLTSQGIPCSLNSGNILVDGEGVAVLTGFGTARGLIANAPCQMTAQPSSAALVVYTAPERLALAAAAAAGRPVHNVAYSPDWGVFSLGILLWELSSGRLPFDEIISRAEAGPRLNKNIEQLSSAIMKGLREETVPGTPEIYEQLFKMCWDSDAESRPPLEVVEETLQMLVVVEPMDMLMLPDDEMNMHVSAVLSESIDGDSVSSHNTATRSNSIRSISPGPGQIRQHHSRPTTLHEAISVSNADMTEWYILSGHDLNGYAIVPTFSLECEITPILTCLGHYFPSSLSIFKELMEQDVDLSLVCKRSNQNGLHVLLDRYIPFKNEKGSAHLMEAVDILLKQSGPAAVVGTGPIKMDVNALDIQGQTPLHLLMRNPRISSEDVAEILKKMMAKGADTTRAAPRDGNVLALAAKYLHFEAVKHILLNDIVASEPESIEKALEACMTMTGRATDKFVNLRTKTRDLLKLWTGSAGLQRREKVVLKMMTDAGQLDGSGMRTKGKVVTVAVPPIQLECANRFYDAHIKKKREQLFDAVNIRFGMIGAMG
ncbi:hypothetical protein BGX29_010861 [Mortierella sp. GBA35]|nr:hypothetical protein BGX29_010861 [Mortierella sp. GBA35]